jgi:hypothetical protein
VETRILQTLKGGLFADGGTKATSREALELVNQAFDLLEHDLWQSGRPLAAPAEGS